MKWIGTFGIIFTCAAAAAQKAPEAAYIYPPLVPAGQTTEVMIGGFDLTDDARFFVLNEQVSIQVLEPAGEFIVPGPPYWFGEKGRQAAFPIPREVRANITVPADMPAGRLHWQVANAAGASNTAVLTIGTVSDIRESRRQAEPQTVAQLPASICGRLERIAEVDRYQFKAMTTDIVTIELIARRIGSPFHGVLEIRDAQDKVIADVADTQGKDASISFRATAGQTYTVCLHDVDFRGNRAFVYRLQMTTGPRVLASLPMELKSGRKNNVQIVGYGLKGTDGQLESASVDVDVPATGEQINYQVRQSGTVSLPVCNDADTLIVTSNEELPDNVLKSPCRATARMPSSGVQQWKFEATKGVPVSIRAESRAIGTDLDLSIAIKNSDGKQLQQIDDLKNTSDAVLLFAPPEDGGYVCEVRDLSGNSGRLDAVYRLQLLPQPLDFDLVIPQKVAIEAAGTAKLNITVNRRGGHDEDIALTFRGLPPGVTVEGDLLIPAKKTSVVLTLKSAEGAAVAAGLVEIVGTSMVGEQTVERIAKAPATGNLCPRDPANETVSQMMVSTFLKPTFKLKLIDRNRQRAVHRGTTYPAPFIIERDEGFDGSIHLMMAARQGRHRQGITAPILPVPEDATNVLYPCFMPEWLETDRTTRMVVLAVGAQADPSGKIHQIPAPADARVTMILEGALLKLSHSAPELTVPSGTPFEIPVRIDRASTLQHPVRIRLAADPRIAEFLELTEEITLNVDQDTATLKINTKSAAQLRGRWPVRLEATCLQENRWTVLSETSVEVEFIP